jgi:hypothetical protein
MGQYILGPLRSAARFCPSDERPGFVQIAVRELNQIGAQRGGIYTSSDMGCLETPIRNCDHEI